MVWYLEMWRAMFEILKSPFVNLDALWMLIPVFILWVIFEIYFDLHKEEPLGWNSALGNGVSMFWIGMNLMTYLFTNHRVQFRWERFIAVLLIVGYALFISYIAFAHKLKAKTVFLLASPTPIYYISFVTIVWAYGSLHISLWVLIDLILFFPCIVGIEALIRKFTPDKDKGLPGDEKGFSGPATSSEGPALPSAGKEDDFKF